jgi:hypothetical protein
MNLSPREFVSKYYTITDPLSEKSVDVLLPNLRYKNKNVYFVFNNPVKVIINGKREFKNEILLPDLSLEGSVNVMDIKIKCNIIEEEREDGLKVNLKYMDQHYLYNSDICKFARAVESAILKIDIFNEDNENIEENDSHNLNYYYESDYEQENNSIYDEEEYYENDSIEDEYTASYSKFNDDMY